MAPKPNTTVHLLSLLQRCEHPVAYVADRRGINDDAKALWRALQDLLHPSPPVHTPEAVETFTAAYLEAALWADNPNDPDAWQGPGPCPPVATEWSPDWLRLRADCVLFLLAAGPLGAFRGAVADPYTVAGHDFWLTQHGHGSGFWDGEWADGDRLTALAQDFKEVHLFTGDDGKVRVD